ncbi:MAG: hypothetical protein WBA74_10195, partial [Cyclobacteriaceae bacterium]
TTSRPTYLSVGPDADHYDTYKQSVAEGVSSFYITLANEEDYTIARRTERPITDPYEALNSYRKIKNIRKPIIESLTGDGESFYYVWYSIFTRQIIVSKLPVGSANPHYDLSKY